MRILNWDSGEYRELDVDALMQAVAASAAEHAVETGDGVIPEELSEVQEGAKFRIPLLIPEEMESGDGRKMKKDALSTRDLPIPLLWQPATGNGHDQSYIVGRIDTIERMESGLGNAQGVFDTGPYGREAERLVRAKMLRGVSADLDQFEATVDGEDVQDMSKITNEKMVVDKARVMAATLVAKPAFQECTIELVDESAENTEEIGLPDGVYDAMPEGEEAAEIALSALMASAAPTTPPATWFNNPNLERPTPLTVDDDGRVYGHIASWETDHIGYNYGVRPPRSRSNYAYFRTGLVRTDEGNDVAVGQLTLSGGHAPLDADARRAVKHYDDTNSAVADVAAGEDQFGIWVAGALRPGVTPEQVRIFRASAPSGDWRPVNGNLELVAVCQVNVPGFPIARARVASGAVMALVAAGAATLHKMRHSQVEDLSARVEALEQRLLAEKKAQLTARLDVVRQERVNKLREAAAQARSRIAPELDRRAAKEAELAARREEVRAKFNEFMLKVDKPFNEALHPRDDEGKFRKVLFRLSELLDLEANFDAPDANEAKVALERAADLEEAGDADGAKAAADEAYAKLESAARQADELPGVDREAPDAVGAKLHKVAEEIETAAKAVMPGGDADSDVDVDMPESDDDDATAPVGTPEDEVDDDEATDILEKVGEVPAPDEEMKETPVPQEPADLTRDEVPQEFLDLIDMLLDELGESVDPKTIYSRMDTRLRHWLEGKGFESPEAMARQVIKMGERPVQPDIGQ